MALLRILLIILALLYIIFPRDLLPDFMPPIGWLDDILVGYLLWRYLYRANRPRRPPGHRRYGQAGTRGDRGSGSGATGGANGAGPSPLSPHELLGVAPDASQAEIRKAYLRLVNQYHPDKVSHLGREFQQMAEQRFKEIQQAYQKLKEADRA